MAVEVVVREYDQETDREKAEDLERKCEVGPSGKLSIYTDLLGDPVCRVRQSPAFLMLVLYYIYILIFCLFSSLHHHLLFIIMIHQSFICLHLVIPKRTQN